MAKILIIGGGVAGLSAGIYARKNGHRAIVCERHKLAGGNLTAWKRGEYTIDNCIHWLTGTNGSTDTYRTWKELGALGDVEVYQGETLYTCDKDGKRLSLHKDLSVLKRDMLAISPADKRQIHALVAAVETLQGLWGIAGEKHTRKYKTSETLTKAPSLVKYFRLSTGALSDKFKHPLLREFLSCFIGRDFSAFALLVVFATFCGENGGIPQGGSLGMAKRICKRFEELGGELLTGKQATEIRLKNGKATSVRFSDGTTLRADYIVCATDAEITFKELLKKPMPKALQRQYDDKKMLRFSSYHTAFACDTDEPPFSGDFIFKLPEKYKRLLCSEHLILREFSHEKTFAPKGKTVLQSLTFCEESAAREFIALRHDKAAYERKKKQITDTVYEIIVKKFPALKGKLHLLDVWTPATYERFTGAPTGAYMSFLLPPNRIPKALPSQIKGLKNVYLATQWQQAPGGLPTAAQMGKRAIESICQKEKYKRILPTFHSPKPRRKARV